MKRNECIVFKFIDIWSESFDVKAALSLWRYFFWWNLKLFKDLTLWTETISQREKQFKTDWKMPHSFVSIQRRSGMNKIAKCISSSSSMNVSKLFLFYVYHVRPQWFWYLYRTYRWRWRLQYCLRKQALILAARCQFAPYQSQKQSLALYEKIVKMNTA